MFSLEQGAGKATRESQPRRRSPSACRRSCGRGTRTPTGAAGVLRRCRRDVRQSVTVEVEQRDRSTELVIDDALAVDDELSIARDRVARSSGRPTNPYTRPLLSLMKSACGAPITTSEIESPFTSPTATVLPNVLCVACPDRIASASCGAVRDHRRPTEEHVHASRRQHRTRRSARALAIKSLVRRRSRPRRTSDSRTDPARSRRPASPSRRRDKRPPCMLAPT